MSDVFISHVEEDEAIALEIAAGLEAAGYSTWYYERDSMPGLSYLLQTKQAVEASRAVVVIVSPASLQSPQMTKEVVRAHEANKPFIPVLRDVTHAGFQQRQPEWWEAMGAAASVRIPAEGVAAILPRILGGLRGLGILSQAEQARAVSDLVVRADQAAAAGDWEQAAANLERAQELAPNDAQLAEKLATVRAGQRSQRLDRLRLQAEQALAKGDWSAAEAALVETLALAPDDAQAQTRLAETRQGRRVAQLAGLRARAEGLAKAERWDEALAAWREYLAQEPEDHEAGAEAVREAEKRQAMARAYAEAEAALKRKDYDRAIDLLRELIVQDVNYRRASALLAQAVELRRTGGRRGLERWQMATIAGVALIALIFGLSRLLPMLNPVQPQPTAQSTVARAPVTPPNTTAWQTPVVSNTLPSPATQAPNKTLPPATTRAPTQTKTLLPPTPQAAVPTNTRLPGTTARPTPPQNAAVQAGTPLPQPLTAISPENAGQVSQLARWGKGTMNRIALSPDWKWLAVASSFGIYLYDSQTLQEVRFIATGSAMYTVAFSPDGTEVISWSGDEGMQFWRVADGVLTRTLEGLAPSEVAFSRDGTLLAGWVYIDYAGSVRLWGVADGVLQRTLAERIDGTADLAFSPDDSILAVALYSDGIIRLLRVADGKLLTTIQKQNKNRVSSIAFSPDGKTLAAGSYDNTIGLWRVADGALLRTLEGHKSSVSSVVFSPDGTVVASSSADKTIRLWGVADGKLLRTLEGHTGGVGKVIFSLDGEILASCSPEDGTARFWRVADGSMLRSLEEHTRAILSVEFSPDGKSLALGSRDDSIQLRRVSHGGLLQVLKGHTGAVLSMVFSSDGATLVSGSSDSTVRLWQVVDGALLRTSEGHTGGVTSVAFSPDGKTVASGSSDMTIRLWASSDGALQQTLSAKGAVADVTFSPDGRILAGSWSGEYGRTGAVQLWATSDWMPLRALETGWGGIFSVAFSPSSELLAVGSSNYVLLGDPADVAFRQSAGSHTNSVLEVAFSHDGRLLASGSRDKTVQLRRVEDGALLQTLVGHTEAVQSVAFSPDDKILASAGEDGTIRLWGVAP
jgi:WD40 repeat protein/tetratricopeptide (TPR) repeat protein